VLLLSDILLSRTAWQSSRCRKVEWSENYVECSKEYETDGNLLPCSQQKMNSCARRLMANK